MWWHKIRWLYEPCRCIDQASLHICSEENIFQCYRQQNSLVLTPNYTFSIPYFENYEHVFLQFFFFVFNKRSSQMLFQHKQPYRKLSKYRLKLSDVWLQWETEDFESKSAFSTLIFSLIYHKSCKLSIPTGLFQILATSPAWFSAVVKLCAI